MAAPQAAKSATSVIVRTAHGSTAPNGHGEKTASTISAHSAAAEDHGARTGASTAAGAMAREGPEATADEGAAGSLAVMSGAIVCPRPVNSGTLAHAWSEVTLDRKSTRLDSSH